MHDVGIDIMEFTIFQRRFVFKQSSVVDQSYASWTAWLCFPLFSPLPQDQLLQGVYTDTGRIFLAFAGGGRNADVALGKIFFVESIRMSCPRGEHEG